MSLSKYATQEEAAVDTRRLVASWRDAWSLLKAASGRTTSWKRRWGPIANAGNLL